MTLWAAALDGSCGPNPVCKPNMQVIGYTGSLSVMHGPGLDMGGSQMSY